MNIQRCFFITFVLLLCSADVLFSMDSQPDVVINEPEFLQQKELEDELFGVLGSYFLFKHDSFDGDYDNQLMCTYERINNLITLGARVDVVDFFGRTPLLFSAAHYRRDFVLLFLNKGAQVNVQDDQEKTPLHYAAQAGWYDVVEKLLILGAEVDALDAQKLSPLKLAYYYYYKPGKTIPVVRLLMSHGSCDKISEDTLSRREVNDKEMARMFSGCIDS